MEDVKVKSNYKDTIFRMLFSDKENLLSLYNALNGTEYTDAEGLEVTTLENAVYMNYRNDVSFVFSSELMIYEHQSTFNPNMPLRDLIYVTHVLQSLTRDEDLYSSVLVRIPAPRFVIFYNGIKPQPEKRILRLSDAFEGADAGEGQEAGVRHREPELELVVTAYNINAGSNPGLMEACQTLKEYAQYVEQVRERAKDKELPQAVEEAVCYCIQNGILAEFLLKNRAEAIAMSIFEYDEEKHIRNEKELSYRMGMEEGHKTGMEEGHRTGVEEGKERLNQLNKKLLKENRIDDLLRSVEDETYQKKLYEEYNM